MSKFYSMTVGKILADKKRKRIALAVFIPLCIIAVLLTVVLTMQSGLTATGDQWDLRNFTTGIVVKDGSGNVVPPGANIDIGKDYTLTISFKERLNLQFAYDNQNHLVYQLPPNIVIENPVTNAPIPGVGAGNPVTGHYSITTGGEITVWFDDVYLDGKQAPGNFIDIYTDAAFKIDFLAQYGGNGGSQSFDFGNNLIINWNLKEPPEPPEPEAVLRINKNSTSFNSTNNTINYTVTLTAENGNMTISKFSDWARKTSPNQNVGSMPDPGYINLASVVVRNNGAVVPSSQYSIAWRTGSNPPVFDIDFNPEVTLVSGRSMTVTYTMNLTDFINANYPANTAGDYYFNVHNEATVTYKDPKDKTKTATDYHDVGVGRWLTSKSGSYNSTTGRITWTINIGDGKTNLAGTTVSDTLGAGIEASARPSSVNMTLRTTSGGTPVWSGAVPTVLGSGRTFTFQIPSSPSPVYYATITYTTAVNPDINYPPGGQYYNNVDITLPNNGKSSAGTGVFIGRTKEIALEKDGRFLNENTVEWTIIVDVPLSYYEKEFYLQDYIEATHSGAFEADNNPENITVKVNGVKVDKDEAPLFWNIIEEPEVPSCWNMVFNGAESVGKSKWPCDYDVRLEITYTQDLSKAYIMDEDEHEYLKINGRKINLLEYIKSDPEHAVINDIVPVVKDECGLHDFDRWVRVWLSWPVWKNCNEPIESGNDTIFTYEVTLNANKLIEDWWKNVVSGEKTINKDKHQLFPEGGPAIFFDEFDERLEYVPGSFKVELRSGGNEPYGSTSRATYKYSSGQDVTVTGNKFTADLADLVRVSGTNHGTNWYTTDEYNIVITYDLKLSNGKILPDQIELKNTAGIDAYSDEITGHFTSDYKVKYGKKAVSKDMSGAGNIAAFDIIINPKPVKLDDGHNLCVTDKMNSTLAFYLTSIKVYTETNKGSGNFDVLQTLTQTPELDPKTAWTWTLCGENEFTIVIPDETPVKVQYEALIKGNVGQTVHIENYVDVSGKYYDEYIEDWMVTKYEASSSGSLGKFLLYKKDAQNTNKYLKDAKFALYIGLPTSDNWNYGNVSTVPIPTKYITPDPANMPQTIIVGDKTFWYLGFGTTDESGTIPFSDPCLIKANVDDGAVFMVREITPPPGYETPANPNTIVDIYTATGTDFATISNTSKVTGATIHGEKIITGAPPAVLPLPKFTYNLIQVTDDTGKYPVFPVNSQNRQTTDTTGAGTFGFSFTGLGQGATYYMITEAPGSYGTYWLYDETIYIVRITVEVDENSGELITFVEYRSKEDENGEWSAWSGTANNTVTFTNRYIHPDDIEVILNALKNAAGKPMTEKQFSFELYTLENWLLKALPYRTVKNADPTDGGMKAGVQFGPLTFNTPGVYKYILKETDDSQPGWKMEAKYYLIEITVYEDEDDDYKLKATVIYTEADEDGEPLEQERSLWSVYDESDPQTWPAFTNTYGGPVFPEVGGIGLRDIIITGLLMILVPFGGVLIYKHNKRRRCLTLRE